MRKPAKGIKKRSKTIDATERLVVAQQYRKAVNPRTDHQRDYVKSIINNTITFCQGVAGSGKTHIAIGMALEYLLDEKVKKIVITRPVVESGLDEVNHFISSSQFATLKLNNKIDIVPLGLMRGRNFHNAFIVADECQNASYSQLKMLLTRIGMNSKMVLTGDISQSDLYRDMQGGFHTMTEMLTDIEGIAIQRLDFTDIVRNPIISKILGHLDKHEQSK